MKINKVEDPAAVLAIPTEEDAEIIEDMLDSEFDDISFKYTAEPADESDRIMTKGSLLQELLAQLHKQ